MKLYISGPMTGYPDFNFPAFNAAAKSLSLAGYEVENPADKGIVDGWNWEDYLRYDLIQMLQCDGVALLDKWEESKGAVLEERTASAVGMSILHVSEWLDLVSQKTH